ncbi:hypothetical protein AMES_8152 [Amycolatopsis mediterranei S699]|uniref:Uncharacterized protein n=1 Tax=Amycolatopsis mediterranei (strain U-32) TaxID=749927 RepID=A0A0H3DIF3_AMYMU|nr:hypothetical protein AMED_8279 [Amycolatopsis mediterranei U32]AFO81685.1 hypothetical protein AMES_8152 [Amycolatopsis mediterranei S699]AGT88814.1 hypothetical protein B737_8153 [Amycolatopsis mediterranei RB]
MRPIPAFVAARPADPASTISNPAESAKTSRRVREIPRAAHAMAGTGISIPGGAHSGDRVTNNTFSVQSDRKELSDSPRPGYWAIRVSPHHPIGHCPVRPDAPTVSRLLGKSAQWRSGEYA